MRSFPIEIPLHGVVAVPDSVIEALADELDGILKKPVEKNDAFLEESAAKLFVCMIKAWYTAAEEEGPNQTLNRPSWGPMH